MVIEHVWEFLKTPDAVPSLTAFVYGFILALLLVLLVLVWSLIRQHRKERAISVSTENGDLLVSINAVKEFVSRIVREYSETSLRQVRIKTARDGIHFRLTLAVVAGTEIVPLVDKIRRQIQQKAERELGIEEGVRVNVVVKSLSSKGGRPGRAGHQEESSAEGGREEQHSRSGGEHAPRQ